jgi:hypothetical protein
LPDANEFSWGKSPQRIFQMRNDIDYGHIFASARSDFADHGAGLATLPAVVPPGSLPPHVLSAGMGIATRIMIRYFR